VAKDLQLLWCLRMWLRSSITLVLKNVAKDLQLHWCLRMWLKIFNYIGA